MARQVLRTDTDGFEYLEIFVKSDDFLRIQNIACANTHRWFHLDTFQNNKNPAHRDPVRWSARSSRLLD